MILLIYPSLQTHYCSTIIQLQFFNNCSKYQYLRYESHSSICKADRKFSKKLWKADFGATFCHVRSFWAGMEQHHLVRSICVQEWLSLWASPRCSPSRQCPLTPQLLSRAHSCLSTQQSVHNNTEGCRNHVSKVWCHLRGQWDWTDALTADAGSSHSGLYTDTAEVEPRAYIPHWVRAVLTQHIQVPQGCSAGPSEAAAVLLLQLCWLTRLSCQSCQGNCQSHAQLRQTGLSWKHPQCHDHSNCIQKLPWDLKADSPHQ